MAKTPRKAAGKSPGKRPAHAACHGHTHDPAPALESALNQLKSSGLKLTRPRQTLLNAIVGFDGPFSTEELFRRIQSPHASKRKVTNEGSQANPETKSDLDLVTVYRSLATFSDLGIVGRVDLGDGIVRYELAAPDGSHHHHIVCTSCQKIEPLNFCEIEVQENDLARLGYSGLSHRLEFFGICPDCTVKESRLKA